MFDRFAPFLVVIDAITKGATPQKKTMPKIRGGLRGFANSVAWAPRTPGHRKKGRYKRIDLCPMASFMFLARRAVPQ